MITTYDQQYHIPCEVCGKWTLYIGKRRLCQNCWEVESRLEEYLKTAKGREFVVQKLTGTVFGLRPPEYEKDHIALDAARSASREGFQVRLSNKAALGYWWAYYDNQVCQAGDPADAILGIYKTLDVTVKDERGIEITPRSQRDLQSR
jgi:hypothetical protein